MTTPEIRSFIQRLTRRELIPGELAALTTRDLDDINAYLAECAEVSRTPYGRGLASATFKSSAAALQQTYSEAEILAEFGVLH